MHTMYYNYGYKVAFWIEIMYSKNIDSHSFLNALTKYIRENHLDSREKFIPVIKDTTHNVDYKERNRNQRKPDYLGKEGTGMPRWHRQYKERMQQKIQNSSANDTHVSNPSDKPKPGSKFGKF